MRRAEVLAGWEIHVTWQEVCTNRYQDMGRGGRGHQSLTRKSDPKSFCHQDTTRSSVNILEISNTVFRLSAHASSGLHHIFLIWEMILALSDVNDLRSELAQWCPTACPQPYSHTAFSCYSLYSLEPVTPCTSPSPHHKLHCSTTTFATNNA